MDLRLLSLRDIKTFVASNVTALFTLWVCLFLLEVFVNHPLTQRCKAINVRLLSDFLSEASNSTVDGSLNRTASQTIFAAEPNASAAGDHEGSAIAMAISYVVIGFGLIVVSSLVYVACISPFHVAFFVKANGEANSTREVLELVKSRVVLYARTVLMQHLSIFLVFWYGFSNIMSWWLAGTVVVLDPLSRSWAQGNLGSGGLNVVFNRAKHLSDEHRGLVLNTKLVQFALWCIIYLVFEWARKKFPFSEIKFPEMGTATGGTIEVLVNFLLYQKLKSSQ